MNAIVMNTKLAAVTEYDRFNFHALTPTHGGTATGLFKLEGNTDDELPIEAKFSTGISEWGSSLKKYPDIVYFAMKGAGTARMTVSGENSTYQYTFPVRSTGQSRCLTGRGIRENYFGITFANLEGANFRIDRIEAVSIQSVSRRV